MTRWRGARTPAMLAFLLLAAPVAAQTGSEDEPVEVEVVEKKAPEVPPLSIELKGLSRGDVRSDEAEEEEAPTRWAVGAWCPVRSEGRRDESPDQSAEGEGEDQGQQEEADGEGELGCDAGAAVALLGKDFRQGRLSLVGVLGAQSLGIGGAWTFGRQGGHPLSVAVGVVAPYSSEGVFADEWAVAVGATVSAFGRR